MEDRKNIQEELREIAPLLQNTPKTNVFRVPGGYFTELPSLISEKTHTLQFSNTRVPYAAPHGYFDDLPGIIMKKIAETSAVSSEEELSEIAPTLVTIGRKNVFSVPDNFFSALDITPYNKDVDEPQARIVPLKRRNWYTYASAAIISGLILLGGFAWLKDNNYHHQFNKVKNTDMQAAVSTISDAEISHFLDHQVVMPEQGAASMEEFHEPDVNEVINNMSNQEIMEYLDNNKEPGETVVTDI
ncbi:hypothetical protein QTN47_25060 [Danxiaibacter flavus]|uniref:CCDC81-like prokaryotic HU domain-containing protein n=1 Tax=Danxiaibacter flavus TaxID=3049108 RepID=A0ABV3ZLU8_9BACT|nr:hypothetical protein QNM32_25065 [Chitinophagaceae bacterium DXS]